MNTKFSTSDEIDISEVVKRLWVNRWLVCWTTLISLSVGVTYSIFATPWYRSEVVMVAADRSVAPSRLSQLGGLASLAGIDLGGASGAEPLAVLKSKSYARDFLVANNLVKSIAPYDSGLNEEERLQLAVQVFDEQIRSVSEEKKAGTVTLMIQWRDPDAAADWANKYVAQLNSRLQSQAINETQQNISFLQAQIRAADVVPLQQSLGAVLESELQKYLLAKGNKSFAYRVIDEATAPLTQSKPNRIIVILLSLFFGLFLSLSALFLKPIFLVTR